MSDVVTARVGSGALTPNDELRPPSTAESNSLLRRRLQHAQRNVTFLQGDYI